MPMIESTEFVCDVCGERLQSDRGRYLSSSLAPTGWSNLWTNTGEGMRSAAEADIRTTLLICPKHAIMVTTDGSIGAATYIKAKTLRGAK